MDKLPSFQELIGQDDNGLKKQISALGRELSKNGDIQRYVPPGEVEIKPKGFWEQIKEPFQGNPIKRGLPKFGPKTSNNEKGNKIEPRNVFEDSPLADKALKMSLDNSLSEAINTQPTSSKDKTEGTPIKWADILAGGVRGFADGWLGRESTASAMKHHKDAIDASLALQQKQLESSADLQKQQHEWAAGENAKNRAARKTENFGTDEFVRPILNKLNLKEFEA